MGSMPLRTPWPRRRGGSFGRTRWRRLTIRGLCCRARSRSRREQGLCQQWRLRLRGPHLVKKRPWRKRVSVTPGKRKEGRGRGKAEGVDLRRVRWCQGLSDPSRAPSTANCHRANPPLRPSPQGRLQGCSQPLQRVQANRPCHCESLCHPAAAASRATARQNPRERRGSKAPTSLFLGRRWRCGSRMCRH